jgi:hypothetical protein
MPTWIYTTEEGSERVTAEEMQDHGDGWITFVGVEPDDKSPTGAAIRSVSGILTIERVDH